MIYRLLDIFFVVFHSSLIIFNISGWIWRKTRLLNLVTLLLTGASWVFLGMLTGTPGYCPFTDWHFNVLEKLGQTKLPSSYIKYLADRISGLDLSATLVDKATLYCYLSVLVISIFLNIKDLVRKRKFRMK